MPVLDASLLISMYLGNDANFAAANRWAERSLRDREKWAIPIIALAEVAAGISRNTQMAAPAVELGAILANLEQLHPRPIDLEMGRQAARIAEAQRIRGCDAVYVALALELDQELVTFDLQQGTRAREVVRVIMPS